VAIECHRVGHQTLPPGAFRLVPTGDPAVPSRRLDAPPVRFGFTAPMILPLDFLAMIDHFCPFFLLPDCPSRKFIFGFFGGSGISGTTPFGLRVTFFTDAFPGNSRRSALPPIFALTTVLHLHAVDWIGGHENIPDPEASPTAPPSEPWAMATP